VRTTTPTRLSARRIVNSGSIVFNGGTATRDCTVRTLSETGAEIAVSSTLGIPARFNLVIRADHINRQSFLLERTPTHIEVAFV
jgi:hypothetical protein